MTTHLVSFSDESMSYAADRCILSALAHGVDNTIHWSAERLRDTEFYQRNKALLDNARGCGFWAWKPYVIMEAMWSSCRDGDVLVYSDAGVEFIDNVNYIIDRMNDKRNRIADLRRKAEPVGPLHSAWDEIADLEASAWTDDIFLFGNQWEHAHWCKADIVHMVWPKETDDIWLDAGWERFGKQVQASVIFFKVNDKTRAFVREWLDRCLMRRNLSDPLDNNYLIDDSPSISQNHPEFRENRHDQAIVTTMAYRDGYRLHWWPAMYNDGAFTYERGQYPDEGYPVLFHHHRKRNSEWQPR